MASIEVKDTSGNKVKDAELAPAVFDVTPNMSAMHDVVRAQRAAWRGGNANTLTRGKVSGGGKRPWRQKGTGRARQGSNRAPQWIGGGVVFGPHTRSYAMKVPNKVVKLAMRSALSAKLADGELVIVDAFDFEKPSTKQAAAALAALGCEMRTTVIVADDDVNAYLSLRNLPRVNVIPAAEVNTYEVIDNKRLVITMDALARIEEVLA
ncbi:MAG: 50S ribosomal protein L4 [Eggerthellaceae bacterium]|nr:50S ribosomal protein L4 [Eggerthellaceae bacterium]